MKVIFPTSVNDDVFVSSTVPENDYAEWSSATNYSIGNKVIIAATHQVYEALTANTNKPPATSKSDWLNIGYTNRWAMFDQKVGTKTTGTASVSVVLEPGIVTGVALFGVNAAEVRVVMTDAVEGVVYDLTKDLNDYTGITDWYAYFFEDVRRKPSVIFEGLPSYRNAQLTVTASGGVSETIEVGSLLVGRLRKYADYILSGASVGIQDFSRKERDAFGNFQIVERAFADLASWSFILDNSRIDSFREQMATVRSIPSVYIGDDRFSSTLIYGFFRDFSVVIPYDRFSECSIEIEGLT